MGLVRKLGTYNELEVLKMVLIIYSVDGRILCRLLHSVKLFFTN
jgi:hypothetical protein